ncbi:MAG: cation diffusion facilitator family transporter [Flavobacteriales bacterium]
MLSVGHKRSFNTMLWVLISGVLIMLAKFVAWIITDSVTILSDALESIVHVIAQSFALYSVYYAAKPKDRDHPYGHGKIESFSVALEGILISVAAVSILIKSVYTFFSAHVLSHIDVGIYITSIASVCNLFLARWLMKVGRNHQSAPLVADGKHLMTDVLSSMFMIIGLVVIYFTKWYWLDSVMGLIAGFIIVNMGFDLIKGATSNLMDQADEESLHKVIQTLDAHRVDYWIDIHKLRLQKFGKSLHIDAHVTLPYYLNVIQAHDEVDAIEQVMREELGDETELFLHIDPCVPDSCEICMVKDCMVRMKPFVKRKIWGVDLLLSNEKHKL